MLHIDWIESNQGNITREFTVSAWIPNLPGYNYVQSDVGLSNVLAKVIRTILLLGQMLLSPIESLK